MDTDTIFEMYPEYRRQRVGLDFLWGGGGGGGGMGFEDFSSPVYMEMFSDLVICYMYLLI